MYHAPHFIVTGSATTGALAVTGANTAATFTGAVTLVFLGIALLRLVPKKES